jgi:hypothetical protein
MLFGQQNILWFNNKICGGGISENTMETGVCNPRRVCAALGLETLGRDHNRG